MITVEEAEKLINSHSLELDVEIVPLAVANNRVLGENLYADRDFPPFHRVTMDGIAIRFEDWQAGAKNFQIVGTQAAGSPALGIDGSNQAIEVMTGADLPGGTDTVIPYEVVSISEDPVKTASIDTTPSHGQNVHIKGSDRESNSVIVRQGSLIGSPEIGIAATVGKSALKVVKPPEVAIISTGDELVPIDQKPLPHQIRSSNAATISSALGEWNVEADLYHIVDDLNGTTSELRRLIDEYQILILSGGVSRGKFDYVPQALEELKVNKHFHRIRQRHGKPFWFGSHSSGTLIFAFPGNPVSSFMCFNRYLKPWMHRLYGLDTPVLNAKLTDDIHFNPDLTYFAQVKIDFRDGTIYAKPVEGHGSGDLANLVDADGFMELPSARNHFVKDEVYPVYPYRCDLCSDSKAL